MSTALQVWSALGAGPLLGVFLTLWFTRQREKSELFSDIKLKNLEQLGEAFKEFRTHVQLMTDTASSAVHFYTLHSPVAPQLFREHCEKVEHLAEELPEKYTGLTFHEQSVSLQEACAASKQALNGIRGVLLLLRLGDEQTTESEKRQALDQGQRSLAESLAVLDRAWTDEKRGIEKQAVQLSPESSLARRLARYARRNLEN